MRRIVDLLWLALLAYMAASWRWVPEWVGSPRSGALPRNQYMALMLAVAVICPWLVTRGTQLIARHAPALLSLPNKDYWLAPERREPTLARLGNRLAVLGLGLTLLFAGIHTHVLLEAHPEWPRPPKAAWIAGGVALVIGFNLWLVALLRHFTRLEPVSTAPAPRYRSRNDELVWRESQPMWAMFVVLALTGFFVRMITAPIPPEQTLPVQPVLPIMALVLLLLGRLVTEVHGDSLRWHYGWLGWPRWRVDLDDIVSIEAARSTWLEGWGIRFTGEGMLYNSHGTQAVRLRLRDGRRLRLGSQDPQRLVQVLTARIAAEPR